MLMMLNCLQNSEDLHIEVVNFYNWCNNNSLDVNPIECRLMTFTRRRGAIDFQYNIVDNPHYVIEDLRVYFTYNLKFNTHVDTIVYKDSDMELLVLFFFFFFFFFHLSSFFYDLIYIYTSKHKGKPDGITGEFTVVIQGSYEKSNSKF
ncbi:uncharacterized protein LOC122506185 [Leptopilina heterotoma]|uniref:uncharacterized protein LOC122506185 n=1 Tax=Leptopilina heterotoma TaxID=63436 RepID=UPI001CA938A9|nr:uncharacterized protein LOC122506185 [Leptopilina heterotoma]